MGDKIFISILLGAFLFSLAGCMQVDKKDYSDIALSNLPVVIINTYGKSFDHDNAAEAKLTLIRAGADPRNLNPSDLQVVRISIKKRGMTSMSILKSQFAIKISKALEAENQVSLLGLAPDNKWVLYGPYFDKTFLRNYLAYTLWRQFGHYGPEVRFVELYLHASQEDTSARNLYWGVYLLTEKIDNNEEKFNLPSPLVVDFENDPAFIAELMPEERLFMTDNHFQTDRAGVFFTLIYPEPGNNTGIPGSMDYLKAVKAFMDAFEASLFGADGMNDPPVDSFIDLASFADYAILNELAKKPDHYYASDFFWKTSGGLMHAGPAWDYNAAFGNNSWTAYPQGWFSKKIDRPWNRGLFKNEYFIEVFKQRWKELAEEGVLTADNISRIIYGKSSILADAANRNFNRWKILNANLKDLPVAVPGSYEGEVDHLRNYVVKRIDWINDNIDSLKHIEP